MQSKQWVIGADAVSGDAVFPLTFTSNCFAWSVSDTVDNSKSDTDAAKSLAWIGAYVTKTKAHVISNNLNGTTNGSGTRKYHCGIYLGK